MVSGLFLWIISYFCRSKQIKMKKIILLGIMLLSVVAIHAQERNDTVNILHNDISLDVTDFTTHNVVGHAIVTLTPKLSTDHVTFDLEALTVDSVLCNQQTVTFSHQNNKLTLPLNGIAVGDTAVVEVYYHGVPAHDNWGGIFFSGQYAYNIGVSLDAVPHSIGRVWFPCFDEFTSKSSHTLRITTEPQKMAVCGGLLTDTITLSDGNKQWIWHMDEPIPAYLASMAVGDYRVYEDTFHGQQAIIPIQIYAQPSHIDRIAGTFVHLKQILHGYERMFGPYLWPRVGYVLVNFSGGAMEHATNIAYPMFAVTGTTNYETLYGHELFHHWFGDLITCTRPEEMWINEGFAEYSEALCQEILYNNETTNAYLNYLRDMHRSTLKNIVTNDGGHYALDDVPQSVTYGMHSYQKGALIVHTLRQYMGDSLFFAGFRNLLSSHAYGNIASEEMFQYLSQVTGMNLMDFYQGWVHNPGFLHFSIDSIVPVGSGQYRVYLRQKLHHATHFANNNKVDLTFVSTARELYTVEDVTFSGEFGNVTVTLPFEPMFGMVDYYEKLMDATLDYTGELVDGKSLTGTDANCTAKLTHFPDTVLVRIEHNLVTPDHPEQLPDSIYRMSDTHYWTVNLGYNPAAQTTPEEATPPEGTLTFRFMRSSANALDYNLAYGYEMGNLKLLYRPNTAEPWRVVPTTQSGSPVAGYLKTSFLASGQYAMAVGSTNASIADHADARFLLYPNPARDILTIRTYQPVFKGRVEIVDAASRVVKRTRMDGNELNVDISRLPAGTYFVRLSEKDSADTVRFVKY